MPQENKYKNWVFTWNNYTDEDEKVLQAYFESGRATYLVYGREVGESGTRHLQGYVQCTKRQRRGPLCKTFRCHVEPQAKASTAEQAAEYCKKDGDVKEFGELTRARARRDLDEVREALRSGESALAIADSVSFGTYLQYHRGLDAYARLLVPTRDWAPTVYYLYGNTGVGKTRTAFEFLKREYPNSTPFITWDRDLKWWDGYMGQSGVILEEFDGTVTITWLLQLLDRYPFKVAVKGGSINFVARTIFITSNAPLNYWYPNALSRQTDALRRRITVEKELKDGDYSEALFEELRMLSNPDPVTESNENDEKSSDVV